MEHGAEGWRSATLEVGGKKPEGGALRLRLEARSQRAEVSSTRHYALNTRHPRHRGFQIAE